MGTVGGRAQGLSLMEEDLLKMGLVLLQGQAEPTTSLHLQSFSFQAELTSERDAGVTVAFYYACSHSDNHLKHYLNLLRRNEPLKPLTNQLNLSLHTSVGRMHKNYFGCDSFPFLPKHTLFYYFLFNHWIF